MAVTATTFPGLPRLHVIGYTLCGGREARARWLVSQRFSFIGTGGAWCIMCFRPNMDYNTTAFFRQQRIGLNNRRQRNRDGDKSTHQKKKLYTHRYAAYKDIKSMERESTLAVGRGGWGGLRTRGHPHASDPLEGGQEGGDSGPCAGQPGDTPPIQPVVTMITHHLSTVVTIWEVEAKSVGGRLLHITRAHPPPQS